EARSMHIVRLRARGRVGHRKAVVEAIAVRRAGAATRLRLEPAVRHPPHGGELAVDFDRHARLRRSPKPEARAVFREQTRAEGKVAHERRHGHAALSTLTVSTAL